MSFYIIEKENQLNNLGPFKDCYVNFIPNSDNFHPILNSVSLIYIRDLNQHKGYILCLSHNESFSLNKDKVFNWLLNNTNKLFVLDKKEALYYFNHSDKLYDINFIETVNLKNINIPAMEYYYSNHVEYPEINKLIPISKHYEKNEIIFDIVFPIIKKYQTENVIYAFNNGPLTNVFYEIECQGIKIDKNNFVEYYGTEIKYPQFNINKSKIYTNYNLYTATGRPSNVYNNINFSALNKNNGERLCYIPLNNNFMEFDIQGYHPRIIADVVNFCFPKDKNTYDVLGNIMGVEQKEAKELTFKQIYGGIKEEYKDKPFFKDIIKYIDKIWEDYIYKGYYKTKNRIFIKEDNMTQSKFLSYIIQSYETSNNVEIIKNILEYLKNKKTKLVLYVYDSFLLDYNKEDGDIINDIKKIIKYPVNIKMGKTYNSLKLINNNE